MMEERISMKIELDLGIIINKFLMVFEDVITSTTYVHNSIENAKLDKLSVLPTDNFPFKFNEKEIEGVKKDTIDWVFKKGVEDLIIAMNAGLVEAYYFAKIYDLPNQDNSKKNENDINNELKKIRKDALKADFPTLIETFEKKIKVSLPFREHILSINKARNCLVHRQGIVLEKDVSSELVLLVKWIQIRSFARLNGSDTIEEITFEKRKNGVPFRDMFHIQEEVYKKFILGNKINFSLKEFNDICMTTYLFMDNLFKSIPFEKSSENIIFTEE